VVEEMCISWANEVCANCGKGEGDAIKLSECTACHFVRYCSDACEKKHLSKHEMVCQKPSVIHGDNNNIKNITKHTEVMPEIRGHDELFQQNKSTCFGDCQICCLPVPIDRKKSRIMPCCSQIICAGCSHANKQREIKEGLESRCTFCREPFPATKEEGKHMLLERVKANDPLAMVEMGKAHFNGGDHRGGFEYYTKAAKFGSVEAHYLLGASYAEGKGVEMDLKSAARHFEEAAIGGHPLARNNLGCHEHSNGRYDRAVKHFIIAANLGFDKALEMVKNYFRSGFVSKDDYEAALRGYQASVDATKSEQRDEAYAAHPDPPTISAMSSTGGQAEVDVVCASCGKAEVDNVKLKNCAACKLVKYCSVDCQKNHRPQHKKACKKRAAENRDVQLFTQPDESCYGECPICCLPLPIDLSKCGIYACCGQRICNGCAHANILREREQGLQHKCLYCREPVPDTEEDNQSYIMERAKANDPIALSKMGDKCDQEGDYEEAFKYYTKAAALGNADAHYNLSVMFRGEGVEKDKKKEMHHLEEASIGGHPIARYNLGLHEWRDGRLERAVKHFIIAAKLGMDGALDAVTKRFERGFVSKDDYEAALRGHQAALDATKSQQRDAAEREMGSLLFGRK
jgi:TPR repeat protein